MTLCVQDKRMNLDVRYRKKEKHNNLKTLHERSHETPATRLHAPSGAKNEVTQVINLNIAAWN